MNLIVGKKSQFASFVISLIFLIAGHFQTVAQAPSGYYSTATGTGATLKTQLYNIIKGHTVISYDGLYAKYVTTDDVNNAGQYVWDMYSDIPGPTPEPYLYPLDGTKRCGSYNSEGDCYNREHSMPASWFADASPMYSDLFHVVPTDGYVNNRRSNFPFGEVSSPDWTSDNGSKVGNCSYPGYSGDVFEPIDEYKGDFARTYFYMATRYENVNASWSAKTTQANAALVPNNFPFFETWFLNMLGEWHVNDPVSQKEVDRNNAIYGIQGNRNPFIDDPSYVYKIWSVGAITSPTEPVSQPNGFTAYSLTLQWSDASGAILPVGYLIRYSSISFEAIANPVDGTVYDGATDKYVVYGTQQAVIGNLQPSTTYYFKLFAYTGSGTGINYKTSGVPQVSKSTTE
jgi:endonuclease I